MGVRTYYVWTSPGGKTRVGVAAYYGLLVLARPYLDRELLKLPRCGWKKCLRTTLWPWAVQRYGADAGHLYVVKSRQLKNNRLIRQIL